MTDEKKSFVFETMVKPSHPEVVADLTNWKPPKTAYVLMEQPVLHIISEGERRWGRGLVTFNAESRAEILGWVENTLAKGGRVLHYGNFPRLDDRQPSRVQKAMLYGGKNGTNPWEMLARALDTKMNSDMGLQDKVLEQQAELDALKAKLAALEAVKAPVEKKPEGKKDVSVHTEK